MQKKLLILGGSRYILPVIKAAHKLGIYVITCDYLPDNIGHRYADEYHNVSIIEKDEVLALARKLQINGILSFATDPGVVVAAYVANKMHLPSCPLKSVEILQNKDLFRSFLQQNNFKTPVSCGYSDVIKAKDDIPRFQFPVIIKPTDSAGSKGVTRVDSMEQLEEAIENAFLHSISGHIIIEEFIEKVGCSSDTDCFSINDELVFTSFDCQYFDEEAANPYTPSAYSWPSDMPVNVQKELKSELQRMIKLLHLGTSIYNVETRLGKDGNPYIMEVSPRGGGNRLSEVLKLACGTDLIEANIQAALGMPIKPMKDPIYNGVWAEYIIHSNKIGILKRVDIEPTFYKEHVIEKNLWASVGDKIHNFTGANETIGTLLLNFSSTHEATKIMREIDKYVHVLIDE